MIPSSIDNMKAMPLDALAGQYLLRPGHSPGVVGQRPVLTEGRLARLLRGQKGEQVGRTLSAIFTLCAHAHRGTANMALAAAQSSTEFLPSIESAPLLWLETARDHLRSIALEWPQRVPELTLDAHSNDWLRDCPLSLATSRPVTDAGAALQALAQLRAWLESRILKQSVSGWLAIHRQPQALALWYNEQSRHLLPASCLAAWYPLAHGISPQTRFLDLLDDDPQLQARQLRELAQTLVEESDFVQWPTWSGRCAETGPWTRLRRRRLPPPRNAWTRLTARWMELLELAAADAPGPGQSGVPLLATGALHLGPGQGLAWSEMARGLLLHWVQLDAAGAVQDYRVLAPTEWNFHPKGALSQALTALPIGATVAAQTLAAAYDPCVACVVQTGDAQ